MARVPMTCTNPGLDRWQVTLACGERSNVKPWDPEFAAVKRQLGEWTVTIEGWEDTYASWLRDARIKVDVHDDVENALDSGAELLARWAATADAKLNATERKTLQAAAKAAADRTLTPAERLAAADNETIAALRNPEVREILAAANQTMADQLKEETEKLLDSVLYTRSMEMKNGFHMSDF